LGEQYKSFSSSLCIALHSPVTSSLLGPNNNINNNNKLGLYYKNSEYLRELGVPFTVIPFTCSPRTGPL
jgi:hypothetical protein